MHKCPDMRDWQLFLEGAMPAAERSEAELHLVQCPLCRTRLIELHDEVQEAGVIESAPSLLKHRVAQLPARKSISPRLLDRFRPYVPLALAATILIAVGLSIYVFRISQSVPGTPPVSDFRQSQGATVDLQLTNPPNGAEVGAGKVEFRWADAGPGARYELTLTDEKGDILYQEKPAANILVLDTSTLKLAPGKIYYWSVSAKLPDGTTRESEVARFNLR